MLRVASWFYVLKAFSCNKALKIMYHFLISTDLHKDRDYPRLWNAMQRIGAVKLLESVWLLETAMNVRQVSQIVINAIDNDDSMAVVPIAAGQEWGALRAKLPGTNWLNANVRYYAA